MNKEKYKLCLVLIAPIFSLSICFHNSDYFWRDYNIIMVSDSCSSLNIENIKTTLIKYLGNEWLDDFCIKKGEIKFVIMTDSSGKILRLVRYHLVEVEDEDFKKFFEGYKKEVRICIWNPDPNLSWDEFQKIYKSRNHTFIFFYPSDILIPCR